MDVPGHTTRRARPPRRLGAARRAGRLAAATLSVVATALAATAILTLDAGGTSHSYYVAIGASEALGFQGGGPHGSTRVTDQGYTNDLLTMERSRWPGLQLVLFACPGLRVDMALSGRTTNPPGSIAAKTTSGRCRRKAGSEVGTASTFIRSHRGQVVLVTVDLGYPDVAACMKGKTVDGPCVTDALARVRSVLPTVVSRLRAAGGSSLRIVGLSHEDPFLAYYLGKRDPDSAFAMASAAVTERFGQVVHAAYASVHVPVARVATAFATGVTSPAHLPRWGTVPLDVQRICTLTWMCSDGNIHPNTDGYRDIAAAVAAALAG
jgi:lysophospholipase L1-like esterase